MDQIKQQFAAHFNNINNALEVATRSGQLSRKDIVNIDGSFENIKAAFFDLLDKAQAQSPEDQPAPEMAPVKEDQPEKESKRPKTKN